MPFARKVGLQQCKMSYKQIGKMFGIRRSLLPRYWRSLFSE